ncbi:MAG TPA: FHA domain-containing protein [Ktedonobacteraceae bacterium]|nr:FHA domain-containing protein [Ktedonobacteraceae bacterium]
MAQEPQEQITSAYLVIQQGPHGSRRMEIWKECTTIGRSRDCDIFLEDLAVHRKQASILFTESGYVLRDDHGGSDSFVNEQPILEYLLHDGDVLRFGNTLLTFYGHEGTRPFQLASSRGRESLLGKTPEPNTSAISKLDLSNPRGMVRSFEMLPEMTIGRSRECDIFLEDLAVSRLHATIRELNDGGYEIEDHRSAAGTLVNGMRITRYRLIEGDVIQIGLNRLTFRRSRE